MKQTIVAFSLILAFLAVSIPADACWKKDTKPATEMFSNYRSYKEQLGVGINTDQNGALYPAQQFSPNFTGRLDSVDIPLTHFVGAHYYQVLLLADDNNAPGRTLAKSAYVLIGEMDPSEDHNFRFWRQPRISKDSVYWIQIKHVKPWWTKWRRCRKKNDNDGSPVSLGMAHQVNRRGPDQASNVAHWFYGAWQVKGSKWQQRFGMTIWGR
jgi:hypothetical protein